MRSRLSICLLVSSCGLKFPAPPTGLGFRVILLTCAVTEALAPDNLSHATGLAWSTRARARCRSRSTPTAGTPVPLLLSDGTTCGTPASPLCGQSSGR